MTKASPTIAITGADGFLGSQLVKHFTDKKWQVVALVLKPSEHASKSVIYRPYDLSKKPAKDLLKGVDYLVHAAYMKQDRQHPEAFATNLQAAKDLVQAAKAAKVKKSLFMSSMSAHDEAVSVYGKQKLAIEKIFKGSDCVSIRSGLIIGAGGIVKQMTDFMRSKHVVPLVGGGKQPLQIIAVSDLVIVIDKLLQSNLSGSLAVGTPQVYSYKQLYKEIARRFKVRVVFVPVPFFVLLSGLKLVSLLPIKTAVNPDNALGLKKLRSIDTAPNLKKIGVTLKPLDEALAAIPD